MSDFPYMPVFIASLFHFIFFTTLFAILIYRNCRCCREMCFRRCGVQDSRSPTNVTPRHNSDSDRGQTYGDLANPVVQAFEMIRLTTHNEVGGDTPDPGMVHINRFLGRSPNDPGMEHVNQFLGRSVNRGRRALSDISDPGVRHVQHVLRLGQQSAHKHDSPSRSAGGRITSTQTYIPDSASAYRGMPSTLHALRGHIPSRGRYAQFVNRSTLPTGLPTHPPDYRTAVAHNERSAAGDSSAHDQTMNNHHVTSCGLNSDTEDDFEAPPTYEEAVQILELRDADLFEDDITPPKYEDVV